MNTARTNDDEETILRVLALNDGCSFITAFYDGLLRVCGLIDLVLKKIGRGERVVTSYAPIFRILAISNGLIFYVELLENGSLGKKDFYGIKCGRRGL